MTAYELMESAFDTACGDAEETINYIQGYASGAFNLYVSKEICEKILECRAACAKATEDNGEGENNGWHLVRKPLEAIEL